MQNTRNPIIYVGGLSRTSVDREELLKKFAEFGKIKTFNKKENCAFIEYYDYHDARKAVKALHRKKIFNDFQELLVEHARKVPTHVSRSFEK